MLAFPSWYLIVPFFLTSVLLNVLSVFTRWRRSHRVLSQKEVFLAMRGALQDCGQTPVATTLAASCDMMCAIYEQGLNVSGRVRAVMLSDLAKAWDARHPKVKRSPGG